MTWWKRTITVIAIIMAVSLMSFRDEIFLYRTGASSSCDHACGRYQGMDGQSCIVVEGRYSYFINSEGIYLVNQHQVHRFGPLLFRNFGRAGLVRLDGTREKARWFDASLNRNHGSLAFKTLDTCNVNVVN